MGASTDRPGRGNSQLIGQDAASAFSASRPRRWAISGQNEADYGIDYLVTSFNREEVAEHIFQVQLKGTTNSSARLSDGINFSHSFDRATLNLWHSAITPVVVIAVDFIDEQDPKTAPVYYKFISPELDDLLTGIPENQASAVIRIPRRQILTRDLDLSKEFDIYLTEYHEARRQNRERIHAGGDRIAQESYSLHIARDSTRSRDQLFEIADAGLEEVISTTSSSGKLQQALTIVRDGDVRRALFESESLINDSSLTSDLERGIAEFIRYQSLSLAGKHAEADHHLSNASLLAPEVDAIKGATAQNELDDIPLGPSGATLRVALIERLSSSTGPSCRIILSKLHALERNFSAARESIKEISSNAAAIARVTITILEGDWPKVIREVTSASTLPGLTRLQELTLVIFEARARFQLSMGQLTWPEEGELTIPPSGIQGMDLDQLSEAHELARRALLIAHGLTWPAVINYIVDVVAISAMALGRLDAIMPTLASLALERAHDYQIRQTVSRLALNSDQPALVIKLREKAGPAALTADEELTVGVAACQIGNPTLGFKYVGATDLSALPDSDINLASLLMIGAAANAASRNDIYSKISERLRNSNNSMIYGAMLDATVAVRNSSLSRVDALQNLANEWEKLGRPDPIAKHVILNSDTSDREEAERVILMGEHLSGHAVFDEDQVLAIGRSYLTLNNYDSAIEVLSKGSRQYRSPRIMSLLGISLELGGYPGRAFSIFTELVDNGTASESTCRNFINGAVRFGLTEKAETIVRGQLMSATDRKVRLQLLSMLYQIESLSSSRNKVLWDIANQYGSISDRDDEEEEGTFLQLALMASSGSENSGDDQLALDLRSRIDSFVAKFPSSKHFRSFKMPDSSHPDDLIDALNAAIGITPEEQHRHKSTLRALEMGELPVPFSWRPRIFLRNVPDVLTLWHLRKVAPVENAAWHFSTYAAGLSRTKPKDLRTGPVVISLVSLLVLDELEILDLALDTFETVIVARGTLISLQNTRGMAGSGVGKDRASRIITALTARLPKIRHPHFPPDDSINKERPWHAEENLAVRTIDCVYYCDDIIESIMVCHIDPSEIEPDAPSISTVDFLSFLNRCGLMNAEVVSDKLAQLVGLKIGIQVETAYLLSAISDELRSSDSWQAATGAIFQNCSFAKLLNGIWTPTRPFENLLTHFAETISSYIEPEEAQQGALPLLWERWITAIRLQDKPNIATLQKAALAFIVAAQRIREKQGVARLWTSFWNAIGHSSVAPDQHDDPDIVGTRAVAAMLGDLQGRKASADVADVSKHIRSGLDSNAQLDAIYSDQYLQSSASAAINAIREK
ncbi:hypothetical protein B9Y61_07210 [Stenotrophomonas maltophilia]|uniref:DUF4365 domain-containing protein n=1 Tax=Stenotrophomonas maltophilia TaxID=40324 RepID=UPI000C25F886|nr:DUF4365 domain-containing protein [Stenotrophomonas maltophilia]PJL72773.1 hypothetical protein B9Y61_07210 [Stenotrophomonas maltophilia]